ncbi:SulP family inorganic anion transporter [Sulfuricurvum sp.]|uniref:SulP family inorganic anion transporter n=1 Tax=Sulfuricurvum sp. TaxID=2025608 RepID=UPI0026048294|nr:SulP family inorganic anion transporter [Sulfuricurvum sp.]MDD2266846.1 SulP family inorganic anion transporter [Sulfuricurvum sp.]MDD2783849.1 SulP family inorganic anion transporter [Sulfuricurvum sp.]HZF71455.1 SulP family inorganic anion transporter [Sulfuricurvum sp.]
MFKTANFAGDFWGGTAAMLVAMPSAIAFGVTIYATMGESYGAYGAIAGILGVAVIGITASLAGGTHRLISAPSAPAAAVLSAFALNYANLDFGPDLIIVMLMVVALLAGIFQVLFGAIGLGRLIKYMPFPVVSGYLSGVGLYIVASQTPKFLGIPQGGHFWKSLQYPALWQWQSITVGLITIGTMLYADRLFRVIPAVIIALCVGVVAYFGIGMIDPALLQPNNPFVIGALGSNAGSGDFIHSLLVHFQEMVHLSWHDIYLLFFPALTLAALLSIDTLKTCIVLDSMTHSFHNSNRELIAQGSSNILTSLVGGMPGSGMMGATMVNLTSGATTRLSGLIEGITAIIAFALLGSFVAWIPVAALAGILIVVGFRMIDRHSFKLLRTRQTALDFFIIVAVAISALTISLIAAAGVGLLLAILLYIIQQIGASVVYRHQDGTDARSKIVRSKDEEAILREKGDEFSIYELHGSLFFGTANQLYTMLREDLQNKKYIIIDMKRVQTVDLTAAHILLQIKDILHDKEGYLLLCRLPHKLPTGEDVESYFNHVGLLKHLSPIKVFDDLDDAIEWTEDKIIRETIAEDTTETPLELEEFDLFKGRKADTIEEIRSLVECRSYKKGEIIYNQGEGNGEIFLIRRGLVRIMLPYPERKSVHLSTVGKNNFFGEFSFLEGVPHYTNSIAGADTDVYCIKREAFDLFSEHHKKASFHFMLSLSAVLAERLRLTRSELGEEYDV